MSLKPKEEIRRSIIKEIVIYDKPNKPRVPDETDSEYSVSLFEGDIILSRNIEETPIKIEQYELQDEDSEAEESIENITREINKTTPDIPVRKVLRTYEKRSTVKVVPVEKPTFKTPRGRPRKQDSTPSTPTASTKNVILNYTTTIPKSGKKLTVDAESLDKSPILEGRTKRVRRRPKKYDDSEVEIDVRGLENSWGISSDEESPPKKKQFTQPSEITSIDLGDEILIENDIQLNELLDEAEEQIKSLSGIEDELQSITTKVSPNTLRGKKSRVKSTPKRGSRGKKVIMVEEDEEDDEELVEEQDEDEGLIEVSREEDSDLEDNRREWLPEELAKYKLAHSKRKSVTYKCKFCTEEFTSYYAVRKHRALIHDDVGRGDGAAEEVEEVDMEDDSDNESNRGEWLPEDYAEYKLKHNINKMKKAPLYKCKICCAVFSNYYKLSKHRVEHMSTNPYVCKQCGDKFGDVESFQAHIRVHQGKDPYKCTKCDGGFDTKEELVAHMPVHVLKKTKIPIKKYRCDVCGKEFAKLCDVERHTRVHTGEKLAECNICHKGFQQAHNLSKHLLTHLHVKPFQCEICNRKFGRIDVLNRHILTHSVVKPFKCIMCEKGFIRQVQLSNHCKKHHPGMDVLNAMTSEVEIKAIG